MRGAGPGQTITNCYTSCSASVVKQIRQPAASAVARLLLLRPATPVVVIVLATALRTTAHCLLVVAASTAVPQYHSTQPLLASTATRRGVVRSGSGSGRTQSVVLRL